MKLKFRSEKSGPPTGTGGPIKLWVTVIGLPGIKSARLLYCGWEEIVPYVAKQYDSWVTEHIGFTLWLTYHEPDFPCGWGYKVIQNRSLDEPSIAEDIHRISKKCLKSRGTRRKPALCSVGWATIPALLVALGFILPRTFSPYIKLANSFFFSSLVKCNF